MELRTLILNLGMQPHSIATWQNAIVLLVTGKARTLESYEAEVSSPSVTLAVPAVMQLTRAVSTHKKGVKFSRINVLTRDGFRCCYCGQKKTARELNYDHVIPRSRGGKTTWGNIVTSCYCCNKKKGDRTPAEARLAMLFKPHAPRTLPMTRPMLIDADRVPDVWRPYLEGVAQSA